MQQWYQEVILDTSFSTKFWGLIFLTYPWWIAICREKSKELILEDKRKEAKNKDLLARYQYVLDSYNPLSNVNLDEHINFWWKELPYYATMMNGEVISYYSSTQEKYYNLEEAKNLYARRS